MAEFSKVMKERNRMCKQIGVCNKCPISSHSNKTKIFCDGFILESPEEAEKVIMEWAEKHPVMTNRRKFEEVFGFDFAIAFDADSCCTANWLREEYKEK